MDRNLALWSGAGLFAPFLFRPFPFRHQNTNVRPKFISPQHVSSPHFKTGSFHFAPLLKHFRPIFSKGVFITPLVLCQSCYMSSPRAT